jgi:hypothetical protein
MGGTRMLAGCIRGSWDPRTEHDALGLLGRGRQRDRFPPADSTDKRTAAPSRANRASPVSWNSGCNDQS